MQESEIAEPQIAELGIFLITPAPFPWCFFREVLLSCDHFLQECCQDCSKYNLQYLATAAIKKTKRRP
jgi:hypothetical protein